MMLGLLGASARAPIERVAWLSVKGVQLSPPSEVAQTPPPAAATYNLLGSYGLAAIAATRPLAAQSPGDPSTIGAGPTGLHDVSLSGIRAGATSAKSSPAAWVPIAG